MLDIVPMIILRDDKDMVFGSMYGSLLAARSSKRYSLVSTHEILDWTRGKREQFDSVTGRILNRLELLHKEGPEIVMQQFREELLGLREGDRPSVARILLNLRPGTEVDVMDLGREIITDGWAK